MIPLCIYLSLHIISYIYFDRTILISKFFGNRNCHIHNSLIPEKRFKSVADMFLNNSQLVRTLEDLCWNFMLAVNKGRWMCRKNVVPALIVSHEVICIILYSSSGFSRQSHIETRLSFNCTAQTQKPGNIGSIKFSHKACKTWSVMRRTIYYNE